MLEKEERKARRRERKRREREAENRNSRRFSAASSKLERMAPILDEDPNGSGILGEPPMPRMRGRPERRSTAYSDFQVPELPNLPESQVKTHLNADDGTPPPPPVDKDSVRSASSSRQRRPIPPPKEGILRSARSRGSTLHLVTTSDALGHETQELHPPQKVRRKPSQAIVATWKNWTHWIVESTRRHRPNKRGSMSTPNLAAKDGQSGASKNPKDASPRPHTSKYPASLQGAAELSGGNSPNLPNGNVKGTGRSDGNPAKKPTPAPLSTSSNQGPHRIPSSTSSYKRQSLSPSPLTPRSTMRRSSIGLRGRKSTSSSLSSIRTMPHHHHSHSKASSTSSTGSVSTTRTPGRSPHHSVKVLPATPTSTSFPSNIRLVRGPTLALTFNEGMPSSKSAQNPPGSPNPFMSNSPSVLFAKRKRNIFKGPTLSIGNSSRAGPSSSSHSRSASASGLGRRSGEITIQEEDEEAEEAICDVEPDDDVEEVEHFSPILQVPGEKVEEIYEGEADCKDAALDFGAGVGTVAAGERDRG